MSRLHFIGGEKGGVGKSVISRLLAQYYIDREVAFKSYDADLSHGAMMRYYSDFTRAIDVSQFDQVDSIVEENAESDGVAIVDLAAQTSIPLKKWIVDTGLLELAGEIGMKISFWHVMDDGSDSLKLLHNLLDDYSAGAETIVVRNHGRGTDFSHLSGEDIQDKLTRNRANVIDIPALHAPTMRKIDHIDASFWAAANNSDNALGPTLGLLERQRVKTWLYKAYTQFDRVHRD